MKKQAFSPEKPTSSAPVFSSKNFEWWTNIQTKMRSSSLISYNNKPDLSNDGQQKDSLMLLVTKWGPPLSVAGSVAYFCFPDAFICT